MKKRLAKILGVVFLLVAAEAMVEGWTAFGKKATGERRARMERSPQWKDGAFENPQPLRNDFVMTITEMFKVSANATPLTAVPIAEISQKQFQTPPDSGLRVTWWGHSSMLVELDGTRVLTDPVWTERVSPVSWVGPKRWFPTGISLEQLPKIDAVVISHDHYDHLDYPTLKAMKDWKHTRFLVPLGVGAHLESWGIPVSQIDELDWWDRVKVGGLEIVATPARHASGRGFWDKDATLWAGWALIGPKHRVYYSGDTGLFPAMKEIGSTLGPFDLTMIEAGQYNGAWPDWHIGPEQSVKAHQWVQGKTMMPVHWSVLTLAMHGWTEPVERVLAEAKAQQVTVITPKPRQSVEPEAMTSTWWPQVPWLTAKETPIVSSQVE